MKNLYVVSKNTVILKFTLDYSWHIYKKFSTKIKKAAGCVTSSLKSIELYYPTINFAQVEGCHGNCPLRGPLWLATAGYVSDLAL